MLIKTLKINNLRNISSSEIAVGTDLNVLIGDNGAGKTTVLEALIVLAKGRSFRTGQVSSLLGPETDRFQVVARILADDGRESTLGLERSMENWRARRDGHDVKHISHLAESLPLVLLEPNSHLLVSGPPDGRRRYLDWGVFHVEHGFLDTWRRYARAVKQRNAALRQRDARLVASMDPLLEKLGGEIHRLRTRQVETLKDRLPGLLAQLGPGLGEIDVRYQSGWSGMSLASALEETLSRDLERGMTGPGPHRADLVFRVGGRPARESLSRGEMKIMAASLLMAQAAILADVGVVPVILLDDLASEFDATHRANVLRHALSTGAQTWVTGTELDESLLEEAENAVVFHVEQGRIQAA